MTVNDHAVEADVFAQRPAAGEELGLGLRADDADVGALLVLGAVEEAALIDVQLQMSWYTGRTPFTFQV